MCLTHLIELIFGVADWSYEHRAKDWNEDAYSKDSYFWDQEE
jgi:hypothetical protein